MKITKIKKLNLDAEIPVVYEMINTMTNQGVLYETSKIRWIFWFIQF